MVKYFEEFILSELRSNGETALSTSSWLCRIKRFHFVFGKLCHAEERSRIHRKFSLCLYSPFCGVRFAVVFDFGESSDRVASALQTRDRILLRLGQCSQALQSKAYL